jgi:hypothetical protein
MMTKNAIAALAVTLLPALAMAQTSPQQGRAGRGMVTNVPSAEIPGVTCSGKTLDIGLNPGGGFGVGTGIGTGFRFPNNLGEQAESLAFAFWGEGWKISYKQHMKGGGVVDTTAFWQPDVGFPPPATSNFEPVSAALLRDDDQACVYKAVVRTSDHKVYLTFNFEFQKEFPSVVLTTTVSSGFGAHLFDVVYARAVDYDVHNNVFNDWTSNDSAAFASGDGVTLSVAGFVDEQVDGLTDCSRGRGGWKDTLGFHPPSSSKCDTAPRILLVDEDTFDVFPNPDYDKRGPGDSIVKNRVPANFDGFASIHYLLGELQPGKPKSVVTVYSGAFNGTGGGGGGSAH